MINNLVKNVSVAKAKIGDIYQNGLNVSGTCYVDKNWNINLLEKNPNKKNMKFKVADIKVCYEGQKSKVKKKKTAIQKQLTGYGVALDKDVKALKREVTKLKKQLAKK